MKLGKLSFDNGFIYAQDETGRMYKQSLLWYPALLSATDEQRQNYTVGFGGFHWRDLDEDISFEFVYDEDTEQAADEEEPMERSEQDDDDMPSSPFSFQVSESQQPVEESVEPPVFNPEPQDTPRRAIDMRKSLSINDYYRFRRELFEGNEEEMNDALNAVMHMDSAAQVENYFYNVKGWNRDSDDVAYFMEIVHNLFD